MIPDPLPDQSPQHIQDCHLGDNWRRCPACIERYQDQKEATRQIYERGARRKHAGRKGQKGAFGKPKKP